jgi:pimeloyl-ACP methyl ester carboxylesterase
MSAKPGESGTPAEPPLDEPGAAFVRRPTGEQTQDLLPRPRSAPPVKEIPTSPGCAPRSCSLAASPSSASSPEADPFNFLGLVRQPVLMVNGRYDFFFPVEETQVPMFKHLGTPGKDKRHLVLEAGHVPPNDVLTKEVLDWLDRYFGPTG